MHRFIIRAVIAAVGLALAAMLLPGVSYDNLITLAIAAILLGVVNAFVRPILVVLTLPLTIITLGLFLLVVNAAMIGLVAMFLKGFVVKGLMSGVLAGIIVSITSWVGHKIVGDDKKALTSV